MKSYIQWINEAETPKELEKSTNEIDQEISALEQKVSTYFNHLYRKIEELVGTQVVAIKQKAEEEAIEKYKQSIPTAVPTAQPVRPQQQQNIPMAIPLESTNIVGRRLSPKNPKEHIRGLRSALDTIKFKIMDSVESLRRTIESKMKSVYFDTLHNKLDSLDRKTSAGFEGIDKTMRRTAGLGIKPEEVDTATYNIERILSYADQIGLQPNQVKIFPSEQGARSIKADAYTDLGKQKLIDAAMTDRNMYVRVKLYPEDSKYYHQKFPIDIGNEGSVDLVLSTIQELFNDIKPKKKKRN